MNIGANRNAHGKRTVSTKQPQVKDLTVVLPDRGGGGSALFTIWCCIPISRPSRVIRRFKRRSCIPGKCLALLRRMYITCLVRIAYRRLKQHMLCEFDIGARWSLIFKSGIFSLSDRTNDKLYKGVKFGELLFSFCKNQYIKFCTHVRDIGSGGQQNYIWKGTTACLKRMARSGVVIWKWRFHLVESLFLNNTNWHQEATQSFFHLHV